MKDAIVFDVEADGLLDTVSKVWCIAATDVHGNKQWLFTDQVVKKYEVDGTLEEGVKFLLKHDRLICHNIMGYDYHVFEKFWPELWNMKTVPFKRCWDTLTQSKSQWFDRPRLKGTKSHHGLEYWGLIFKYPKPPIEDWTYFDEDKLDRVLKDIEINRRTYNHLNREAEEVGLDFHTQIRRTQAAQYWYTKQELYGTYGDVDYMKECVVELDKMINDLAEEIEPNLPIQLKVKSPKCTWEDIRDKWKGFYRKVPASRRDDKGKIIKPTYMPVTAIYKKNGMYQAAVAKWFGISDDPKAQCSVIVSGPYTKIEYAKPKMSQHAVVKEYLLSIGWKPTQWNFEKDATGRIVKDDAGNPVKKSPKLTEDSYDSIEGDIGKKIATYNTYTHRRRTIQNEKSDEKGWINQIREDGRISAGCMAWSTSTGRGAQKGIVNVPSTAAVYGYPMRRAWIAPEGKTLISVDQNSAQIRLLANYMGDPEYTEAVIHGEEFDADHNYVGTDAHTINAMAFGTLPPDLVERARNNQEKDDIDSASKIRKKGKNGFYALLFGAGDAKLATTLGFRTAREGSAVKESFRTKLKAAGDLQDRLVKQWKENPWKRGGYIQVAGGTWVWCPSEHKLLNYLLMGSEAVVQNEAICWVNVQMKKRGLHGHQLLSIHDELTFEFSLDEEAEGVRLLSQMYEAASKRLKLEVIIDGQGQSGSSWADIH